MAKSNNFPTRKQFADTVITPDNTEYTIAEASAELRIGIATLRSAVDRTNIPYTKRGGVRFVKLSDIRLSEWFKKHQKRVTRGTARGISLIAASAGFAGLIVTIASIAQ